jgi:hypothetical protein
MIEARRWIRRLLLVGAAWLATPSAHADTYPDCAKQPSSGDPEVAHQKYIAGKQDYDEGNYDSAIRRFKDAYTLDCTKHELLVIISAAYERKGDKKEAASALEAYVARAPNSPDVGTYQAKIDNLKRQMTTATPPAPQPPPAPEHTIYPWIAVAVGGTALAVGVAILVTTPSLPVGCSKTTTTCQQVPDPKEQADRESQAGRAKDQPTIGIIVMVAGGAVAVGGLVWHFLEPTTPKETAKTRLSPMVAPGLAGLSLGGSF